MSFCEMAIYRTDEAGDSLEAGDWELNACPLSLLELTLLHHSALYPCPLVASWEPAQFCGLHDLPDSLLMQGDSNIAKLLETRRWTSFLLIHASDSYSNSYSNPIPSMLSDILDMCKQFMFIYSSQLLVAEK